MAAAPRYLVAALELLDEYGIAEPGFGLSMKSAALAAGVTRSTIYRHWETASDLNDDLARFVVADLEGWQRRVVADDLELGLGESIAGAMSACGVEPGAGRRMFLAGWPEGRGGRVFAEQWEAAWLEALATHVANHLRVTGRRVIPALAPAGDGAGKSTVGPAEPAQACRSLAVAIAALVEGAHIFALYRHGQDPADWDASFGPNVGTAVSRFMQSVTEADAGGPADGWEPVAIGPLPESGLTGAKAEHLGRIIEHIRVHPFGSDGSPTPPRLVDMARLARRAEISERWLYELWPTVGGCNADILIAVLDRDQDVMAEEMFAFLASGLSASGERDNAQAWVDGMQSVTEALLQPDRTMVLGAAQGLMDPEVRGRMAAFNKTPGEVGRGVTLSLLGMLGEHLMPEVSADEFNDTMFSAMLGLFRLVLLHRELLIETASFEGREVPLCGLVSLLVKNSMATPDPPGTLTS